MVERGRTKQESPARLGRRPGGEDTRQAILDAARTVFAARGYARGTIRAVAAAAGVDPALVIHYFGSKESLFVAAMRLPFDPRSVLPALLAEGPEDVGARLAQFFLDTMEAPDARERVVAMVRAAVTEPAAAEMLQRYLREQVLGPLAALIPGEGGPLRLAMAGSQLMGFVFAKYVVGAPPLATASRDDLMALLGPTLQRYLTGGWTPGAAKKEDLQ